MLLMARSRLLYTEQLTNVLPHRVLSEVVLTILINASAGVGLQASLVVQWSLRVW